VRVAVFLFTVYHFCVQTWAARQTRCVLSRAFSKALFFLRVVVVHAVGIIFETCAPGRASPAFGVFCSVVSLVFRRFSVEE
jgi:hypothetical protein